MNDVRFIIGEGGLGRPLAGEDHISAFIGYVANDDLPAGFAAVDRIKKVFSIDEVIELGITADNDDIAIQELFFNLDVAYTANPKLEAYIGLFELTETATPADLTKIVDVQRFAEGRIRRAGIFNPTVAFVVGQVTALQAAINTLAAEHKPLSVFYSAKMSAIELANLPDLRPLDAKGVSVVIGSSASGLAEAMDFVPSSVGLAVGFKSRAKVSENIGWVAKFNAAANDNNEFDVPCFLNGVKFRDCAPALIEALNTKGYIFLKKHIGLAGTYFNDSHTCITATSDFAYNENVETIDKAVRNTRTYLLPSLNAPLMVNANGTLTEDTILTFKTTTERALEEMQRNGEISAFEVVINPAQNVLQTSELEITIKIVPVGVARNIVVKIGYTLRVAA